MLPGPYDFFGIRLATWDIAFLVAIVVGYVVLRGRMHGWAPSMLLIRYVVVVYVCALAAQLFAYLFDAGTSLTPPEGSSALRYYFYPLAGPKTLYGAILALPVAVAIAFADRGIAGFARHLDGCTPALMTILGTARIGCFLQGCCYGLQTAAFGLAFPVGSSVHADQFLLGLVRIDDPSLPVLPTQLASAAACFVLAAWSWREVGRRSPGVFVHTAAMYSVFRFLVEILRADPARNHAGPFSTSQWIALAVLTGIAISRRWSRSQPA